MAISIIESEIPMHRMKGVSILGKRDAIVLSALIAANCIFYMLGLVSPPVRDILMLHSPSVPTPPLATAALNWRAMASYTFVHSGPWHLLFNMAFLGLLGRNVIRCAGLTKMLMCYFTGAIAGGLGFLTVGAFFPSGEEILLCGASAAILALAGASIACNPTRPMLLTAWSIAIISIITNLNLPGLTTHLCGFLSGYIFAKLRNSSKSTSIGIDGDGNITERILNQTISSHDYNYPDNKAHP